MTEYIVTLLKFLAAIVVTGVVAVAIFAIAVVFTAAVQAVRKDRSEARKENDRADARERHRRELQAAFKDGEKDAPTVLAGGSRYRRVDGTSDHAGIPSDDVGVPQGETGLVGVRYREPALRSDITGEWRRRIVHPDCPGVNGFNNTLDGWFDLDHRTMRPEDGPFWTIEDYDRYVEQWVKSGMSYQSFVMGREGTESSPHQS